MNLDPEKAAQNFLELASEQRLKILSFLEKNPATLSTITKELEATPSEVHRNINRLLDAGLVIKHHERDYDLSLFGKVVCQYTDSLFFIPENKKFFENHTLGNLPPKYIHRLGALQSHKHIKGFVKVIEQWKKIHSNADEFIYNILAEVPYSEDIIDVIESKLDKGIKVKSIFSEKTIIPDERKEIFVQRNFQKYVKSGVLERKMQKNVSVIVQINEKEAGVMFPNSSGNTDMGEMFYSKDESFREWCLDFFNENWNNSTSFQESKLDI